MNDSHQPRPEFVSHLQWQVQTALNRRDRFAAPARRSPWRNARIAALILVSLLCGAAGVMATEEIQESKNRELLLARVEAQIRLAEVRLNLVRAHLEEIRQQQQAQLVGEEAMMTAMIRYRETEAELARLRLDLEEIRITGEEPQNRLSAPLIAERDFFTERLQLHLSVLMEQKAAVDKRLARMRTMEEAGIIGETEVQRVLMESRNVTNEARNLETRIALRQRFLRGELTEDQVAREADLSAARIQLELQQQLFEIARNRFARIQELHEKGLVSETELLRYQFELMEREVEVHLLQLKLQQLMSTAENIPPARF